MRALPQYFSVPDQTLYVTCKKEGVTLSGCIIEVDREHDGNEDCKDSIVRINEDSEDD